MRVHILSKMGFDNLMETNGINDSNVEKFDSIMFISIVDTQNQKGPYFKENHDNVINLRFDDVEHDGEASPTQEESTKAFSEEQADELYKFIKKNREKETCIVHCMAGISRSSGCGLFIVDYTKSNLEDFNRRHPWISPNQRVYRMLKNRWYDDLDV
jgi:predicted protein tyrosine phosphatase